MKNEKMIEEIEKNHLRTMQSIQKQLDDETAKHKDILNRLGQQRNILDKTRRLNGDQMSGKLYLFQNVHFHFLITIKVQFLIHGSS